MYILWQSASIYLCAHVMVVAIDAAQHVGGLPVLMLDEIQVKALHEADHTLQQISQTVSADMDANSDDSYYSPAEDEDTAKERSFMNLRDIELRCMRAAPVCYTSSSKYEDKGFYIRCAGAAASGGISLLSASAGSAVMEPVVKKVQVDIPQSMYFTYLIGAGIGIVTFYGMLKAVDRVIGAWYDEKAPKYNEAAAEWQELELQIKAFLAAAVKGTITVQDCKQFTEECAEKLKKICLIARPSSKIHEMYESNKELFLKSQKSLREIHKKRRENHLF